jgi:hypothetical protein
MRTKLARAAATLLVAHSSTRQQANPRCSLERAEIVPALHSDKAERPSHTRYPHTNTLLFIFDLTKHKRAEKLCSFAGIGS